MTIQVERTAGDMSKAGSGAGGAVPHSSAEPRAEELHVVTYGTGEDAGEGRVFPISGGDWDEIAESLGEAPEERIVVNMGPQHPSTHGVLRLILELEGETVTEARVGIGYLHTGIEKNLEFRNWTQGTTFVTRMDYLTPFFQETAYCLA